MTLTLILADRRSDPFQQKQPRQNLLSLAAHSPDTVSSHHDSSVVAMNWLDRLRDSAARFPSPRPDVAPSGNAARKSHAVPDSDGN